MATDACDAMGESTLFIEFMLECLLDAMENYEDVSETEVQDKVRCKFPEVSQTAWNVLAIIQRNPQSTVNEICGQLELKERQVYKDISLLKSLGLIACVGSNKTGYWKVSVP